MKTIIGLLIAILCVTATPVLASHQSANYYTDHGTTGSCSFVGNLNIHPSRNKTTRRDWNYNLMSHAIYRNDYGRVRRASSAEINATNEIGGVTPILVATRWGKLEFVKLLLTKGANINHQKILGSTALHYAAVCGHGDIVQYLLAKGAATQINDKLGMSPAIAANAYGHPEMAKLITAKQRRFEARVEKGWHAFAKSEGFTADSSQFPSSNQVLVDQNKAKGETMLARGKRQLANAKQKILDSTTGRVTRSYDQLFGKEPKVNRPFHERCLDKDCIWWEVKFAKQEERDQNKAKGQTMLGKLKDKLNEKKQEIVDRIYNFDSLSDSQ